MVLKTIKKESFLYTHLKNIYLSKFLKHQTLIEKRYFYQNTAVSITGNKEQQWVFIKSYYVLNVKNEKVNSRVTKET